MPKIIDLIKILETFAPTAYQESYDNCGLIVGDANQKLEGILVCLDCTEEVIDEALAKGCNLVVAHHPIIFGGLKKLNGKNYVERAVIKAIKNELAIYAIHTNLDNVSGGVNFKIGDILGLKMLGILKPKSSIFKKITTFVPGESLEKVAEALHKKGAGNLGNYTDCSFRTEGIGTFTPNEIAKPYLGSSQVKSYEKEVRLEMIFPSYLEAGIITVLRQSHPYEEVAFDINSLDTPIQNIGAGAFGYLEDEMDTDSFFDMLKDKMGLKVFKHTDKCKKVVKKIAVCGGSGSFLLKDAKAIGADVFISSDFKYHEFFDAENEIIIIDIGHYESEIFTKDLICEVIRKKMANIAVILSETNTNPINYY